MKRRWMLLTCLMSVLTLVVPAWATTFEVSPSSHIVNGEDVVTYDFNILGTTGTQYYLLRETRIDTSNNRVWQEDLGPYLGSSLEGGGNFWGWAPNSCAAGDYNLEIQLLECDQYGNVASPPVVFATAYTGWITVTY